MYCRSRQVLTCSELRYNTGKCGAPLIHSCSVIQADNQRLFIGEMSESSEEETNKPCESQMGFVTILRDFPIVFSKSQTPAVRQSKLQAIELIKKQWELNFGSQITTTQMYKKINNMKTRLKIKTDINRTGNKKIVLQDWEKILLEIMEGDTNPVLAKIPGKLIFS